MLATSHGTHIAVQVPHGSCHCPLHSLATCCLQHLPSGPAASLLAMGACSLIPRCLVCRGQQGHPPGIAECSFVNSLSASLPCLPFCFTLCHPPPHPSVLLGATLSCLLGVQHSFSLSLLSSSWKSSRAWRKPSAWPQQSSSTSQCHLTQPCPRRGAEACGATRAGGVAAPACCVQGWWVLQAGHGAGTVSEPVPVRALRRPGH